MSMFETYASTGTASLNAGESQMLKVLGTTMKDLGGSTSKMNNNEFKRVMQEKYRDIGEF